MMDSTLFISVETDTLIRMLLLGFLGLLLSLLVTPLYTTLAYKWGWWRIPRAKIDGEEPRRIPTMAGIVFVAAATVVTLCFNLSRDQTWLPLAAFVGAAGIGLLDDVITLKGASKAAAQMRVRVKLILMTVVALIGGWYFWDKLDVTSIHVPFMTEPWHLGWLIVPLFMLAVIATANAVNMSDGQDGLAGGLTSTAFATYAVIAALEGRFGVAGFCLAIVGALLCYTWFNIAPARFVMGNVGSFALGTALGAVAMITDTVLILPIIGFAFVMEAGSSVIQLASRKFLHKDVFKLAPIHAHFEEIGWPDTKVTARFWVIGQVCAVVGLIIFLLGRYV